MNLHNFADKVVFKILQDIDFGYLEIINFDGVVMKFGNPEDSLKATTTTRLMNRVTRQRHGDRAKVLFERSLENAGTLSPLARSIPARARSFEDRDAPLLRSP